MFEIFSIKSWSNTNHHYISSIIVDMNSCMLSVIIKLPNFISNIFKNLTDNIIRFSEYYPMSKVNLNTFGEIFSSARASATDIFRILSSFLSKSSNLPTPRSHPKWN